MSNSMKPTEVARGMPMLSHPSHEASLLYQKRHL